MSMIINGSLSKLFKIKRGLRQGDLLSPFLFVLVADILNRMLKRVIDVGIIESARLGRQSVMLSHLQFMDDMILFAPVNSGVF